MTMTSDQETKLTNYLNSLDSKSLSNVKAHGDTVDSEKHDSYTQLKTGWRGLVLAYYSGPLKFEYILFELA